MPDIHLRTLGPLAAVLTFLACASVSHAICLVKRYDFRTRAQQRLGCVDGLRGYLALGVFFHHFVITYYYKLTGQWVAPPSYFFQNCGQAAVVLFFMITGFLFLNRLLVNHRGRWASLYLSRLFRLVPLYWTCVAVVVVVAFLKGGPTLKEPLPQVMREIAKWLTFFWTPPINQFSETNTVIAGVTWTLRYEWLFYLALPLVALALRPASPWLVAACALATVYLFYRPLAVARVDLNSMFFVLFTCGGIAAVAYQSQYLQSLVRRRVFSIAGLIALVAALFLFDTAFSGPSILLLLLFFIPVALGNSMFGVLNLNCSILLGEASYSLYLLQGLGLYLVFSIAWPFYMESIMHSWQLWPSMVFLGMALVVISWLSHVVIERPSINLGKRLSAWLSAYSAGLKTGVGVPDVTPGSALDRA